jgi:biotin carboxylase
MAKAPASAKTISKTPSKAAPKAASKAAPKAVAKTGVVKTSAAKTNAAKPASKAAAKAAPKPAPKRSGKPAGIFTILCLASYEKGFDFLHECRRQGCRVLLLTSPRTDATQWPMEAIDEKYVLSVDAEGKWDRTHLINAMSYVARKERINAIVALDDYDLESAAILRDHFQLRGIGETVTRYFRDKLAMRVRAGSQGVHEPDFVACINEAEIKDYMARVPLPWILKPRGEASAIGVKKITSEEQFWQTFEELGDRRSFFLLEQFITGEIYHVDSLTFDGKVCFAQVHKYGKPPMELMQGGGVFTTRTVEHGSSDEKRLLAANEQLLAAMGLHYGASHTEFIKSAADGQFYFMETAARVGGANIMELVEAATGIKMWAEWAKIEINYGAYEYDVPKHRTDYGGILISLAKQEHPDLSAYNDPEIVWRMNKKNHAGLIVISKNAKRVETLLEQYQQRFAHDFMAALPPPEKPTN